MFKLNVGDTPNDLTEGDYKASVSPQVTPCLRISLFIRHLGETRKGSVALILPLQFAKL